MILLKPDRVVMMLCVARVGQQGTLVHMAILFFFYCCHLSSIAQLWCDSVMTQPRLVGFLPVEGVGFDGGGTGASEEMVAKPGVVRHGGGAPLPHQTAN
jgi:hypothetical protein